MEEKIYLDVSHTCQTRSHTGIQRVTRCLAKEVEEGAWGMPVAMDIQTREFRLLRPHEKTNLHWSDHHRPGDRGGKAPAWTRVKSSLGLMREKQLPVPSGFFCPEVFNPKRVAAHRRVFPRWSCPKVALFHDAIALKLPHLSPPSAVARFPSYMQELLDFDGVATNSEASREELIGYWQWLGVGQMPDVRVLPFGFDHIGKLEGASRVHPSPIPTILSVGTIEGRKNHLALLEAADFLWESGEKFHLHLIGAWNHETGGPAMHFLRRLQKSGRMVEWAGAGTDQELAKAYRDCLFTVYPSVLEGFGMPVAESLRWGKPCVCSGRGALGELAQGGGCIGLETVSAKDLAQAMRTLLHDPARTTYLAREAADRRWPTWKEFVRGLAGWMGELRHKRYSVA